MSLNGGRTPEDTTQTQGLITGSNLGPPNCKATVLTTTQPCLNLKLKNVMVMLIHLSVKNACKSM